MKIAYQGIPQAYSHLVALKVAQQLGIAAESVPEPTFRAVVDAVAASAVQLGVLPIENTSAGSINQVYDLLRDATVSIVGEQVWEVNHCLAAPPNSSVAQLTRVLSHPQALEQCSNFLAELTGCEILGLPNTAEAMKTVGVAGNIAWAAIGSPQAATAYGLTILRHDIANQPENYTRFVVIAATPVAVNAALPCKTSIVFSTPHRKGALVDCLQVLAEHDLNLTKLESRPRPRRPFEYLFYVDFEGAIGAANVDRALHALRQRTLFLKVLGCYLSAATTKD